MVKRLASLVSAVLLAFSIASATAGNADPMGPNTYHVARLVSDVGPAQHHDPNLVNAWGLVAGPATPWWVADNGTDVSTLYDGTGALLPLVVKVAGAPTGTVFNGGSGFVVQHEGFNGPAVFLFATEDGTIRGWNPGVPATPSPSTRSFVVVARRAAGAVYKGLAIATGTEGDLLYATDFHNGRVDVFNESFHRVHRHAFVDPNMPGTYAPFGIQAIGGDLFVTYAKQDPNSDDELHGRGFGFIDRFDPEGTFLGRVASHHKLNAPWGLAWAPSDFGRFSDDLLIGNFGDGKIHAFEQQADGSFSAVGTLRRPNGSVIRIDGLWALEFGNGAAAGPTNSLFFTAGPEDESHGLFGRIDAGTA